METSKKTLSDLKNLLKSKAVIIRQAKIDLKNAARKGEPYVSFMQKAYSERMEFRHHLIAYCELRGMKREQIEKPAFNNQPFEGYIFKIKEQYDAIWVREVTKDLEVTNG